MWTKEVNIIFKILSTALLSLSGSLLCSLTWQCDRNKAQKAHDEEQALRRAIQGKAIGHGCRGMRCVGVSAEVAIWKGKMMTHHEHFGLYHLFMVKLGMVYYCLTTLFCLLFRQNHKHPGTHIIYSNITQWKTMAILGCSRLGSLVLSSLWCINCRSPGMKSCW